MTSQEKASVAMLEESGTIDMVGNNQGRVMLVITDAGITTDADERLALLRAKLETYGLALSLPYYQERLPNYRTAMIRVMCATEPTAAMQEISAISVPHSDGDPQRVEIEYEVLPARL